MVAGYLVVQNKQLGFSYRQPGSLFKEDGVEEIEALGDRVGRDHYPKCLVKYPEGDEVEIYCCCCSGCEEATAAGLGDGRREEGRLFQGGETSGGLLLLSCPEPR